MCVCRNINLIFPSIQMSYMNIIYYVCHCPYDFCSCRNAMYLCSALQQWYSKLSQCWPSALVFCNMIVECAAKKELKNMKFVRCHVVTHLFVTLQWIWILAGMCCKHALLGFMQTSQCVNYLDWLLTLTSAAN